MEKISRVCWNNKNHLCKLYGKGCLLYYSVNYFQGFHVQKVFQVENSIVNYRHLGVSSTWQKHFVFIALFLQWWGSTKQNHRFWCSSASLGVCCEWFSVSEHARAGSITSACAQVYVCRPERVSLGLNTFLAVNSSSWVSASVFLSSLHTSVLPGSPSSTLNSSLQHSDSIFCNNSIALRVCFITLIMLHVEREEGRLPWAHGIFQLQSDPHWAKSV